MGKKLQRGINHVKRLHNLITISLIVSFTLVFAFLAELSVSNVYAQSSPESDDVNTELIFSTESQNSYNTFPPRVITVIEDTAPRKELVYGVTSSEIVEELGIELDDNDLVLPSDDSIMVQGSTLKVIDVVVEVNYKQEEIPYLSQEMETDTLTTGTIQLEQAGSNGVREKTIYVHYYDGEVVKSEVKGVSIIREPVTEITLIGTKPVTIQSCDHWDKVIDHYVPEEDNKIKSHWMKYIMRAETWCNSGSTGSSVYGLFQFTPATFRTNYKRVFGAESYSEEKIWDGTEQIQVVSYMYDLCQQGQWGPYRNTTKTVTSYMSAFPDKYKIIEQSCGR